MIRRIIEIDQETCNGCGLCAKACHEGAIGMINGKAQLLRDDYCDGLGDCLPACPAGAIKFVEREALDYNEKAVEENKNKQASMLCQWPVQIKLVPIHAPYFEGCHLLIAADCTAYACGSFHQKFMGGNVTLIGCPKLDSTDYSEKLTEIIRQNQIQSVTIVKMEVPCCNGIRHAAVTALQNSGKSIPCHVVTISTDGRILEEL